MRAEGAAGASTTKAGEPHGDRRTRGGRASLKARLTRDAATLVVLVLVAMAAASTFALRTILDRQLSNQLTSAAERAQSLLRARVVPVSSDAQILAAVPVGSFVLALDAEDQVVVSNLPATLDRAALLAACRSAGPGRPAALPSSTPPVRATSITVEDTKPLLVSSGGRTRTVTTIVVGFDTSRGERLLQRTALLEVGFTVVAGVVIVLLLPRTVERGLGRIRAMADAARAVAAGDVDRRLPTDADMAETAVLAHAVNDALDARQEAEARMRQFVADASHELRTPLTTIQGWAELHREGGLDDPVLTARAFDRIAESATHLTSLVEDLALLARLDAGRLLERSPVDLGALVETVVEDLRVIDPARPVSVTAPAADEPRAVVGGDEPRLRQVVLNLTGNALQHTPPGTPISVAVRRDQEQVVLVVDDSGPGIPPEHQARIFDRFYRGAANRSSGGTGLGLAIVRSLVDALGGAVAVDSDGSGTRFTVTLPADGA